MKSLVGVCLGIGGVLGVFAFKGDQELASQASVLQVASEDKSCFNAGSVGERTSARSRAQENAPQKKVGLLNTVRIAMTSRLGPKKTVRTTRNAKLPRDRPASPAAQVESRRKPNC
jgi:hypothetical protein